MEWFKSWFNTRYYHMLYRNRNDSEARGFVIRLIEYLQLSSDAKILDLACGKGRHSLVLNELGYDVTGIDLSENSIREAKKFETKDLRFFVSDMRCPNLPDRYDLILNLFTSFGYFDSVEDDWKVFKSCYKELNPNGRLIIDYLNVVPITQSINKSETKYVDDVKFKISKEINEDFIIKHILVEDKGENFAFKEQVRRYQLPFFKELSKRAGFSQIQTFGNYQLEAFDPETSPRLILIFKK